MTSMTDMAGHPDVAEISDLTEGLLPPDRSTDVRRHLDACEPCAEVFASLEEIRELLGAVPAPERMPADVADRIDSALAAEAHREDGGEHVSRETSMPSDRPAGRPPAATGPGRKGSERGRRRRRVALGVVLTAAVLGTGSLLLQSFGGTGTGTHTKPALSAGPFSGVSVHNQVKDLLATKRGTQRGTDGQRPRSGVKSEENSPESPQSANTLIQTLPPVPDCVRKAITSRGDVLGAKPGTYAGRSAYLVVLPDAGDSTRVTAYVVDATCVGRQSSSLGKVLLKQSFARP
ncbi:hypothetical protein AQJ66_17125 [Streptomyces bungoensis]|uniref:Zinc-finger domain-containing protein n=2 Tax=Streptomyces bungoensis TaxID=285568 RepID=A0A101T176_9ACTN|nr:zf-HC2 domain-containing protein [Streptomyces bungoensis]KUN83887.1 hypothetical protein AQJ66_17125 [Streptomyces bungoensis]